MIKQAVYALVATIAIATATPAMAIVTTFATVADNNQDFSWQVTNGVGTLNTNNTTTGSTVNFQYTNLAGLPSFLQGNLQAYMLINGGAGIQTTGVAGLFNGSYFQNLNRTFTITYSLINPIGGKTNLLTVTIGKGPNATPSMAGSTSVISITTGSSSYFETFSSDFLSFSGSSTYSSVIGFNSVTPTVNVVTGAAFMDNFNASALLANFSADPVPTVVPEPGSLAALIGGLMALSIAMRKRTA